MVHINKEYARSMIFGIEDSLVSTTGLIAGLSVGASDKKIVVLGGLVAIGIEALSMGAGEYLSDDAVKDMGKPRKTSGDPSVSGVLMFTSYLIAGFVPMLPVLLLPEAIYLYFSVTLAMLGLFLLGYIKGRLLHTSPLRGALKILSIGGLATALGTIVGFIFRV